MSGFITNDFKKLVGVAAAKRLAAQYTSVDHLMQAVRDEGVHSEQRDVAKLAKAFALVTGTLDLRMRRSDLLNSADAVRFFLRTELAHREAETFYVLFLDNQNRLIESAEMFRGTLSQTAVYPREVVKRAMQVNAAAVIFAHNHPSNQCSASHADRLLTDALKAALGHLDVRVLDHFIVTDQELYSFAEHGLL